MFGESIPGPVLDINLQQNCCPQNFGRIIFLTNILSVFELILNLIWDQMNWRECKWNQTFQALLLRHMSRGAIHYADMPPGPTPLITGAGERVTITAFPHEVIVLIMIIIFIMIIHVIIIMILIIRMNVLYCRCMWAAYWLLPRFKIFLISNITISILLISI